MVINAICKWDEAGLGQTPSEASRYYSVEAFVEENFHLILGFLILSSTYSRPNLFILMLPKCVKDQVVFSVILFFECFNFSLQESILQLRDFFFIPSHWHVTHIYYLPKWIPEGLLSNEHMMHNEDYH